MLIQVSDVWVLLSFLLWLGSEFSDIEYLGDRVCKVTFGLGLTWKGKRRCRL